MALCIHRSRKPNRMAVQRRTKPVCTVEPGESRAPASPQEGLTIPLQSYQSLTLRSDRSSITIASWSKEPWAVAAGRDRYGLWADADVKGVSLRFCWIPPSRFLMGSPGKEAGRFGDEGPQHEVTWDSRALASRCPVYASAVASCSR